MLFRDDVPTRIEESPPAFPPADYEGMSIAADDLPPLLAPRTLMDAAGYSAWECHMVARCADGTSPESVVATLARDARILRCWKPGGETLQQAVASLPGDVETAEVPATLAASMVLHREVMDAVPDDLRPERDESGLEVAYRQHVLDYWPSFTPPLTRYLAAKAFASWTAYQGRGVATIVRGLDVALALVRVEAARHCRDASGPLNRDLLVESIRSADFALNHLAVGEDLAAAWSRVEGS